MEYFESYILKGMNHRKLTFKEIYDIIISEENTKIINESVYNKNQFQELFNYITQSNNEIIPLNRIELLEFFPINSRPFKILNQSLKQYPNNNTYNIIFIIANNLSDKENLKRLINNICENEKDINVNNLYESIIISDALFMPSNNKSIENKYKPSLLWLNKNNLNINDLFHEFIHYLEWIDELYLNKNIIDKLYFADINTMNQYSTLFNLTSTDLEYIFNKKEYQTLLNDFLNNITDLKNTYFNDKSGNQFARYITFNLTKNNETDLNYLNKIKNFQYFNELNKDFSLAMIVGYNLLNFKCVNIRNHIFGKFIHN